LAACAYCHIQSLSHPDLEFWRLAVSLAYTTAY
jgi:hypothetical protein